MDCSQCAHVVNETIYFLSFYFNLFVSCLRLCKLDFIARQLRSTEAAATSFWILMGIHTKHHHLLLSGQFLFTSSSYIETQKTSQHRKQTRQLTYYNRGLKRVQLLGTTNWKESMSIYRWLAFYTSYLEFSCALRIYRRHQGKRFPAHSVDCGQKSAVFWVLSPQSETWSSVSVIGSMQSVVSVVFQLRPHRVGLVRQPHLSR